MKIKVLMFGWEFPPHISGGLGTACYGLTKGLSKHDVNIMFVIPKAGGNENRGAIKIIDASEVETEERSNLKNEIWKHVKFISVGANLIPYVDPETYDTKRFRHIKIPQSDVGGSRKYEFSGKYGQNLMEEVAAYAIVAKTIARREDFDIIHAHDWLTYTAGIMAKKISGKPLVVHVHATEFDRSGENVNSIVYDMEKRGMTAADKIITVSNLTRRTVIEKYGINPDKVVTVYNAVDFSKKEAGKSDMGVKEKIVTFLGRITYQKGPEYFIEADNKILKQLDDVRFVMAGSGDLMNRSIRRAAQLKIASRFHFTGFLKGNDVWHMFENSDVYVMPSVSEPFGISPLEAMQAGVPTIISKQSGVAEILRHAIKIDYWNIDAMADAIYGLLAYPTLSRMVGRLGKEEVNRLKWENAALKVKAVYEQLLKK